MPSIRPQTQQDYMNRPHRSGPIFNGGEGIQCDITGRSGTLQTGWRATSGEIAHSLAMTARMLGTCRQKYPFPWGPGPPSGTQ